MEYVEEPPCKLGVEGCSFTCPPGGIPAYSDFGGVAAVLVCNCIWDEMLDAIVSDVSADIIRECV